MDGVDKLLPAFVGLFERVYHQIQVPAQWLISKTFPIYKNKTIHFISYNNLVMSIWLPISQAYRLDDFQCSLNVFLYFGTINHWNWNWNFNSLGSNEWGGSQLSILEILLHFLFKLGSTNNQTHAALQDRE